MPGLHPKKPGLTKIFSFWPQIHGYICINTHTQTTSKLLPTVNPKEECLMLITVQHMDPPNLNEKTSWLHKTNPLAMRKRQTLSLSMHEQAL